jgi:SAM-dependent methyltransferase
MSRHPLRSSEDLERQRATKSLWEAGDFGLIAKFNESTAAEFIARLNFAPSCRVLDLACGSGNLALLTARAGCITSGVDLASNLVVQAQARARARQLVIDFQEADLESLPFADAHFEVVLSLFGLMFSPRPEVATAELIRVCRPGGLIALAHWNPQGFVAECLHLIQRYRPAVADWTGPLAWGEEEIVRQRLGSQVEELRCTPRVARLRYPFTPSQTVEFFRRYYGPMVRAFEGLSGEEEQQLQHELETVYHLHNRSRDGATEIEAPYLEIVATRK